ncbi:hypothetical protein DFJ58DRAFT_847406 [Suillus subalutaceus]|uniref:uncharacterized protein n=1 Tax=Suillus subalutaceus TaxID=48586 RepID=UPI001B875C4E|nr:uncharacterized protein DFJ58DRAFT_847406 [Suillus subalutaceus]KAG1835397.1 hypothetical protein DFJ58DRAFT_847406 [Suillus subalutaceus]
MAEIPFGTLLWVAARPLLRLTQNITLPSLIFSRASSALNAENDAAFGPLIVIATIYMAIGFALSLFIKRFFWVPYRFRYGIFVAGGWASSCDITISVMTDIMVSLPFDGVHDQDLAGNIRQRLLCHLLHGGEVHGPCQPKRWKLLMVFLRRAKIVSSSTAGGKYDLERDAYDDQMSSKDLSLQLSSLEHSQAVSPLASSTIVQHNILSGQCDETQLSIDVEPHIVLASTENSSPNQPHPAMRYVNFLGSLSSPVLLSVVVSLIVSRISAVKALFIPNVPGTNIPPAPDGQPPLAFVMDTATFLGAANSPIGLVVLGSALARMSVPRGRWTSLPLGAIVALAVSKQLIMPLLGILICEEFTRIGFIDAEDKVLRFLRIMFTHSIDPSDPDASMLWRKYNRSSCCIPVSPVDSYVRGDDRIDGLYTRPSLWLAGHFWVPGPCECCTGNT